MQSRLVEHINKFIKLDHRDITLITSTFRCRKLKKKQFLVNIGDTVNFKNFVIKGCLKKYYIDDKGEEHIVQFAIEDWWIGDLYSYLTQTPSIYNVEALEDSEVLQVDRESMDKLYSQLPKMEKFFRMLAENAYVASTHRVLASISQPAEERYIEFTKKYPDLEERIPQYLVASYLGVTPEFLSKIRRKFAGK